MFNLTTFSQAELLLPANSLPVRDGHVSSNSMKHIRTRYKLEMYLQIVALDITSGHEIAMI
jgi:hypothetical protein